MELKRIEISGFKSFPDPTEVVFCKGVTAIVGPNGCGKSNLTDAVRWVLGEQRARVLRGGKMEEVIFGGTPQRPASTVSEVTLIIDNRSGGLACDYEEVAVTRRLDRSGDSEYRLNRAPCRLKDLTELFLDTGMGSHAYSVIQQGMIDAIIAENTDELRYLFEEAAGVSKYKTRKRAALRKLDATDRDLVRITDLKNEVATRTRSLARQKGKAERYKKLTDELKELRLLDAGREYRRRVAARGSLDDRFRAARDQSVGLQAQCDAMELEWQALRMAAEEAEKNATEAADRLAKITSEWHTTETRRVQLRDRRTFLENEHKAMQERVETLRARREELAARLDASKTACAEAERRQNEIKAETTQAETAYRNLKEAHAQAADLHRRVVEEFTAVNEERSRLDSQHAANTERRDNWGRLIDELTTRRERAQQAYDAARHECDRLRTEVSSLERKLVEQRQVMAAARDRVAALEAERAQNESDLRLWEERFHEWDSARDLLAGMIARGEGLGAAAEAVLSQREQWGGRVTSFSDRLRPHTGWERAVEMAMAGRLGALWCSDEDTARSVTAFLTDQPVGQAVLLDPSLLHDGDESALVATTVDGCVGRLTEKIDCDNDGAPWVRALLGSVLIAETADDARMVHRALKGRFGCVSKDGLFVEASGAIHAPCGAREESIVGRSERLQEFDRKIADGRQAEAETRQNLDGLAERIAEARKCAETEEQKTTGIEEQLAAVRLNLEAENTRASEHARTRDELDADLAKRRASLADDEENMNRQLELGQSLYDRIAEVDSRRQASSSQLAELEERMNAASVALNDARVRSVEAAATLDAAETESRRLAESIRDTEDEEKQTTKRMGQYQVEAGALTEELKAVEEKHAELTARQKSHDEDRAAKRAEASRQREIFSAMDVKIKEARRLRDEADKARSQIEVEQSRLDAEMDQYRQRVVEVVGVNPAEVPADDSPLGDDEIKEKIRQTTAKIDGLGPVNPLALEEYEHEKQRWDFFEKQLGDLRAAKRELAETIDELNRTAGERFKETFETARVHFQDVFTELFRGGEADVRLADPDDPLESSIEVYARPRGKKFIGLRQLSGGERALTALALLFGLYLVKPSPFCILDEVDAPLDDANCGRFLRLIDRFKSRTQFIIVTHNKLTMEAADTLYGVTMETSGISKIVSVRLNRSGEESEDPGLAEPRFGIDVDGVTVEEEGSAGES